MKKFLWAAVLALPFVAADFQKATAAGGCLNLSGCYRLKLCFACKNCISCSPFSCCPCPSPGEGGGCASGGCGPFGGCSWGDCAGQLPGPWYTYWPQPGTGMMTSQYAYPDWNYQYNFQTPAPVFPGYGPGAVAPVAAVGAATYPNYWYGQ